MLVISVVGIRVTRHHISWLYYRHRNSGFAILVQGDVFVTGNIVAVTREAVQGARCCSDIRTRAESRLVLV
jgi:hypothetical protein